MRNYISKGKKLQGKIKFQNIQQNMSRIDLGENKINNIKVWKNQIRKSYNSTINSLKTPFLKCAKDLNRYFSKEDGHKLIKKMLKVISHQGNAIKTTIRYQFSSTRMAKIKKTHKTRVNEDVEKLETSHIACENVKLCSHILEI